MLHELLLALLGYTGDFVIDERERAETLGLADPYQIPDESTFKLASDLSFIQPSERSADPSLFSSPYSLCPFPSQLDNVSRGFWGFVRGGVYVLVSSLFSSLYFKISTSMISSSNIFSFYFFP